MTVPSMRMYIDWSGDEFTDSFPLHGDNVTEYLYAYSITRSISKQNNRFASSTAKVYLRNDTGRFSLHNASSPIYGDMKTGVPAKIYILHGATGYTRFVGYISEIRQTAEPRSFPTVEITIQDGFSTIFRKQVKNQMLLDQNIKDCLTSVEFLAGWPPFMNDYEDSNYVVPYFWVWQDQNPLQAMREIAENDFGSVFKTSRDGKLYFRNNTFRSTQSNSGTLPNLRYYEESIDIDNLVSKIAYTYGGLRESDSIEALYSMSPLGKQLQPGKNPITNQIISSFGAGIGAKDLIEPIAITDYLFNDAANLSGTDKTTQVVVDTFTRYGGGFSILFEVLDSSPVYIEKLQVRGTKISPTTDDRLIEIEASNPQLTNQELKGEFRFTNNPALVDAFANLTAANKKVDSSQIKATIPIDYSNDSDLEFKLGLDVDDKVTIQDLTGPNPTGLDREVIISGISERWEYKKLLQIQLEFSTKENSFANAFIIGTSEVGSSDVIWV